MVPITAPIDPVGSRVGTKSPNLGDRTNLAHLNGLRAIAALLVVCAHTVGFGWESLDLKSQLVHSLGHFGLAVFFCLSGFLLFRPFVAAILDDGQMPLTKPYLINRLLRILPLFWLVLAINLLLVPSNASSLPDTPAQWIGMILLGQGYFNDGVQWAVFSAWTLGIELAFYLALPFISIWIRRLADQFGPELRNRVAGIVVGLIAISAVSLGYKVVVRYWVTTTSAVNIYPPAWFDWFAVGMALATVCAASSRGMALPRWLFNLSRYPALAWLGSIGFFWISVQSYYYFLAPATMLHTLLRHYATVAAGVLLLIPAVLDTRRNAPIRTFLASKVMASLGLISYGLYLWHPGFVKVAYVWALDDLVNLPGFGDPLNRWAILGWVIGASILASAVTYWGVERVFFTMRRSTVSAVGREDASKPGRSAVVSSDAKMLQDDLERKT